MNVEGKVAAITGAAGTLGSALAVAFAEAGAAVVAIGDLDLAGLAPLAAAVEAAGAKVLLFRLDVTDGSQMDGFVDAATQLLGRLDVMINNAGVLNANGRIHNITETEWRRVIDVNLMGTVNGIRSAVGAMRRQESGGSIVNTASAAGISAWPYAAPYSATKAAVIQLTRVAAIEYARDRVRVNCVCPGTFLSNIHEGLPTEALEAIAKRHPLGLGTAADVVGAFLYLAGDASRWTTGSAVVVDGGYSVP
ncbi:MAG TPA: SDR family NAD(P)-dependent oxidoreductase [Candidatus Dormibacteraeota bacterium]|nr:SDR family NAD(P)-dependent oxidoreductase [Candidatus Dormibacteraeota bacterium]